MKGKVCSQKIISLILAFGGMCGIAAEVSTLGQSLVYRDIIFLPVLFVLYKCYQICLMKRETKGFYWLTCGLSFLFSMMLIVGDQLDMTNNFSLEWKIWLKICLLAVAIFPILAQVTLWLNDRQKTAVLKSGNKRVQIICFVVLSLVWLAGYLAMFPGVYGADAPYWHHEFSRSDVAISSQWSPFYCSIFYGLVALGTRLFDSYNAGFAIFSFVQMVFILFVIWNILKFFCKRMGDVSVILVTAFFSLIPTHVILAVSSAQDPVFAACLAMVVIQLLEMAIDAEEFWKSKKEVIKLFIWLILLCMIRNNGLYAIIVMLVFVVIFIKKYRKQIVITLIAAIAIIQIYQGPIYDMIGIEKGTALREMLSLPLQQMAYAYNYAYDKLSEDEISQMQEYISDEGWRSYQPCISDHVKGQLNVDKTREHMDEFIKLYFEVFQASKESYLKAAALQTYGLWYPNKVWTDWRTYHPYIAYLCSDTFGLYDSDFTITRTSLFPAYDNLLGTLFGKGDDHSGAGGNLSMAFSKVPVLGTFCRIGTYTWVLIYLFFYSLYRRWKKPFGVIGLEIGICITVFLSPVIMYRYCAPIIFTAPLFVAILFLPWESEKETMKSDDGERK